jgi:hypothetical protein
MTKMSALHAAEHDEGAVAVEPDVAGIVAIQAAGADLVLS